MIYLLSLFMFLPVGIRLLMQLLPKELVNFTHFSGLNAFELQN